MKNGAMLRASHLIFFSLEWQVNQVYPEVIYTITASRKCYPTVDNYVGSMTCLLISSRYEGSIYGPCS